jgi:hypothetical protein
VLFVGAEKYTQLDLHGQLAQTRIAIARAKFGGSIEMRGLFNPTPERMLMELNQCSPDVLHLSGKQEQGQLKMHDVRGRLTPVSADRLAALLGEYHQMLRLVILDTCRSLPQARRIAQTVDCAIGVAGDITDPVAIAFFAMFYNALASGASVLRAHKLAFGLELAKIEGDRNHRREVEDIVKAKFSPGKHLPELVGRKGINLGKMFLVART